MTSEYLECKGCKKKYPAWSEDILGQLDMGHCRKFPALLTYSDSCDYRVVILMRERTQGNSVTQLHKKLQEEHSAAWTRRTLDYFAACEPFTDSCLVEPPVFSAPPPLPALPKPKWLLAVYARDVLSRLPEVKARITSVFGSVLKMDSTKKLKLVRRSRCWILTASIGSTRPQSALMLRLQGKPSVMQRRLMEGRLMNYLIQKHTGRWLVVIRLLLS
ncbi:uncharacterized protein LOC118560440 [Fundulus heteroclitus]|uniref:uncharacterized protein LOC118560440 n=1 Tax=Fundulus heteroclitus TaxID=8078 RepID=UPI00165A226F|nr:uncharacterized protein LOC118560440 [Fundulus heteroclitus]